MDNNSPPDLKGLNPTVFEDAADLVLTERSFGACSAISQAQTDDKFFWLDEKEPHQAALLYWFHPDPKGVRPIYYWSQSFRDEGRILALLLLADMVREAKHEHKKRCKTQ